MKDMQELFRAVQNEYGVRVRVVDRDGMVQLDPDAANIEKMLYDVMAIDTTNEELHYNETDDGYVITKYMGDLGWSIVIERHEKELELVVQLIAKNILFMIALFAVILFVSSYMLEKGSAEVAENAQQNSFETLASVYAGMYVIDVANDSVKEIKNVFEQNFHLKETQIQIDEAAGGKEALKKVFENYYDIIFLDHMMPDMDGIEVLKEIKRRHDHYNTETSVVVLTANAISGAKENYLKVGFTNYLSKPIIPDKLDAMLVQLIPDSKKETVRKTDIISEAPSYADDRAEEKTKHIPVVFLTSQNDAETVKSVLALKPEGYILKTSPEEKVLKTIAELFEI